MFAYFPQKHYNRLVYSKEIMYILACTKTPIASQGLVAKQEGWNVNHKTLSENVNGKSYDCKQMFLTLFVVD